MGPRHQRCQVKDEDVYSLRKKQTEAHRDKWQENKSEHQRQQDTTI